MKKDPILKNKKKPFDRDKFKKGIAFVESNGGKNLWNKTSSATGKYQFLYNEIKNLPTMKGVTREQFRDNPELQEKVMDLAIDNKLKGRPGYYKNAEDLTNEFRESFGENWNYRDDEVAMMTHFLGRQGTRNYLRSELSGKDYKVPGQNLKVTEYMDRYNGAIKSKRGLPTPPIQNINEVKDRELPNMGIQDSVSPYNFKPISKITPRQVHQSNSQISNQPIPQTQSIQQQSPQTQPQQTQAEWLEQYLAPQGQDSNNQFSLGGSMQKGLGPVDEELTHFEGGGTHEQNPLGGIPQGQNSKGGMNTVEEGETSYNLKNGKFIFSNRIGLF